MKKFLIILLMLIPMFIFSSCNNKNNHVREEEYIVKFNSNGGTGVTDFKGLILEESPITTKLENQFSGWYETADFSGEMITFPYQITKNITLYAKWDENPILYSITFATNGGSEVKTFEGVCVDSEPVTTKEGYELVGWYETADFSGEMITFPYTITKDITLYAKWVYINQLSFTLIDGGYSVSVGTLTIAEEIIIPSTYNGLPVIEIEKNAFAYCSNLTNIIIPNSITSINDYAFDSCTKLKNIEIPESVTYIGSGIIKNTKMYEEAESNNIIYAGNWVIDYKGIITNVTLKDDTIGIASNCFSSSKLENVVLPEGLKYILKFAFTACYYLTNITIPNSVESIGTYAFNDCSGLEKITIPKGVKSMGSNAFAWCYSLIIYCEEISKPSNWDENWNNIGVPVYWSVKEVYENEDFQYYVTFDETITIVKYIGKKFDLILTDINDRIITEIADYAFHDSNITSIILPEGLLRIGNNVFANCSNLTKIIIPKSVKNMGSYAFFWCYKLIIYCEEISTPSNWDENWNNLGAKVYWNVKEINENENFQYYVTFDETIIITKYVGKKTDLILSTTNGRIITEIADNAFYDSNITSIILPEGLLRIGSNSFAECSDLNNISLPTSLLSIGGYAFDSCINLNYVIIPSNVHSIGSFAFYRSNNLIIYCEAPIIPNGWNVNWNGYNKSVYWNVEEVVEDNDFYYIISNQKITITKYKGNNLHFTIPNEINGLPVSGIGTYAFYDDYNLLSLVIPKSITNIEEYAIYNTSGAVIYCESASRPSGWDVYWNSYVKHIMWNFKELSENEDFEYIVTNSNTTILLKYKGSKTDIILSQIDDMQIVGILANTFSGASHLISIIIPMSVINIGANAFSECNNLAIYCKSSSRPKDWDYLWNSSDRPVYWNTQSILEYNDFHYIILNDEITITNYIGNSIDIIIPNEIYGLKVRGLGKKVFSQKYISSIVIPDNVTSIGARVFYGCSNLNRVTFGENSELISIGENSFAYCIGLKEITIPKNVISIEKNAFYNCDNLSSVTFEENSKLKSIGEYSFYDCYNLVDIKLPNSLEKIDTNAFFYCSNLKVLLIPKSVTSVGNSIFGSNTNSVIFCEVESKPNGWDSSWNSSNLVYWNINKTGISEDFVYYITSNDTVVLVKYIGTKSEVVLSTINGKEISEIDSDTFKNNSNLKSIVLPEGLLSIKDNTFNNCYDLTDVVIPNSVTSIGSKAFYDCDRLTSIWIPNSVKNIDAYAFYDCNRLSSIFIPSSVTHIDLDVFRYCSNLIAYCEDISKPSGWNSSWSYYINTVIWDVKEISENEDFRYCVKNDNTIVLMKYIAYESDLVLSTINGQEITQIYNEAFRNCSNLESIVFPGGLTSIGENAFSDCSNLTSIVLPDSLTYIGSSAFSNCLNLESIVLPNNLTHISDYTFSNCSNLTNIVLPDGLTSIGANAFSNCSNLESLILPDSITNISSYAFSWCSGLTSIILPNNYTNIEPWAFYNCSNLTSVFIPKNAYIESSIFSYCDKLVIYCELPSQPIDWDSWWNTANYPVYWEVKKEDIKEYDEFQYLIIDNKITITRYIGSDFEVIVPNMINGLIVTKIGASIFENCTTLTSVVLPDSITSISAYAFSNCIKLINIVIPESITIIEPLAFVSCLNLIDVVLPSKLISIGKYAFAQNSSLINLTIPKSVTRIEEYAFDYCNNLIVYCEVTEKPFGWDAGWNRSIRVVHWGVTKEIIKEYNNLQYIIEDDGLVILKYLGNDSKVVIPNEINGINVVTIASYAFNNCENLLGVVIEKGIKNIEEYAFNNCNRLLSLSIPDTVVMIDSYAINHCYQVSIYCEAESKLNDWNSNWVYDYIFPINWGTIVENLDDFLYIIKNNEIIIAKYIGNQAEVKVPDEINGIVVTAIGLGAFYTNRDLTSIIIPKNIISIGDHAFAYCVKLTNVEFAENCKLKNIGVAAFSSCSSLTNFAVPLGVINIEEYLFNRCENLENITIPTSVAKIGEGAFSYCSSLINVIFENDSNLTYIDDDAFYYCSSLKNITIPSKVSNINNSAFERCSSLIIVKFEEDSQLVYIGSYAFLNCSNLTNILIPKGVEYIGHNAFSYNYYMTIYCQTLSQPSGWMSSWDYNAGAVFWDVKEVAENENFKYYIKSDNTVSVISYIGTDTNIVLSTINDSLITQISDYAFYNCASLDSIFIPSSITKISFNSFYGCPKLIIYCSVFEELTSWNEGWNDNRPVYFGVIAENIKQFEDFQYIIIENEVTITKYFGKEAKAIIPEYIEGVSVTNIGQYLFYDFKNLNNIVIPNSIKNIGKYAFAHCNNLEKIIIPSSVVVIEAYAFYGYSKLFIYCEVESKPSGWQTNWNYSGVVEFWGESTIKEHDGMKYKIVNNQIIITEYIGKETQVVIPEQIEGVIVKSIGKYAFYNNYSLVNLTLPNSLTSIGENAFYNCSSLTSVLIHKNLMNIGSDAFRGCDKLIIFCEGILQSSGWDSSWNVSNRPIYWGTTEEGVKEYNNLKYLIRDNEIIIIRLISEEAHIIIPESINGINVTSIGPNAFSSYNNITSVSLPNNLKIIDSYAFYNCWGLKSILIPNSVTSIGDYAFYNCSSLTNILIHKGLINIGAYAFSDCAKLVIFCEGSKSLSGFKFYWNIDSRPIYWEVTKEDIKEYNGLQYLIKNNEIIIVRLISEETQIIIPESINGINVTSIGSNAFSDSNNLTRILLPNNLKIINSYAFYNCYNLTSILIPNNVTSVEANAFDYCIRLVIYCETTFELIFWEFLRVPVYYGVSRDDLKRFEDFEYLIVGDEITITKYIGDSSEIVIPKCIDFLPVTTIGEYAFIYCKSITSVILPNGMVRISERAFYDCENLVTISIPNSVVSIEALVFEYCINLTIYCEVASKPSGWDYTWNYSNRPVIWGYKEY